MMKDVSGTVPHTVQGNVLFNLPGLCQTTPLLAARRYCSTDSSRPVKKHSWARGSARRLRGPTLSLCWSGRPTGRRPTWRCMCTVLMVRKKMCQFV